METPGAREMARTWAERGDGGKERPTEAYCFVERGDQQARNALRPDSKAPWAKPSRRPRYVADLLTGRYAQLAFLEEENLEKLQVSLQHLRNLVNPGTDTSIPTKMGPMAPTHWSPKPPLGAYIRIKVEPGTSNQVLGALDDTPLYWGSAVVQGTFDILLELGGYSLEDLGAVVEGFVRRTKHVTDADPYYSVHGKKPSPRR